MSTVVKTKNQTIKRSDKRRSTQKTDLAKTAPSLFVAPEKRSFDHVVYHSLDVVWNDYDRVDQCRRDHNQFECCSDDTDSSDDVFDCFIFVYVVCESNVSI